MSAPSDDLATVEGTRASPDTEGGGFEPNWDDTINRLGRYILLERLGTGAFGVVRAAYNPELERKVAIKLLRDDVTGLKGSTASDPNELLEEARMVAKLSHPNVVAIYDVGSLHGAVRYPGPDNKGKLGGIYIVMEHLGGPSLSEWMDVDSGMRSAIADHEALPRVAVVAGLGVEAVVARQ